MHNSLPEHVAENRKYWDSMAHEWVPSAESNWAKMVPSWGIWGIPESQINLLPADMEAMQAIELGCGTAYVSAWMARRGATVVGIDNSEKQLVTARRLAAEHRIPIELIHGNAEEVPKPDSAFDFAISEYGAAIWCDPHVWIPEAYRLLKPRGRLVFLGTHPLAMIATPLSGADSDERLHRDYFSLGKLDWRTAEIDPGGIEFNLPISAWMELFRDTGFDVERYLELQAPDDANEDRFAIPCNWAKRWPSEQVWCLRKG